MLIFFSDAVKSYSFIVSLTICDTFLKTLAAGGLGEYLLFLKFTSQICRDAELENLSSVNCQGFKSTGCIEPITCCIFV